MDDLESKRAAAVRQNLHERLLDAIKQCQVHFGARQEIASEEDLRVVTLCTEWEAVLLHGMKRIKPRGSLRFTKNDGGTVSMWPLARLCLSQEETQRFAHMKSLTTDIGRGRAWLRASVNERRLESYLHDLLAEVSSLESLYDPHAFLLDDEHSSTLPIMAAGLSSIIFSITVAADYLNLPLFSFDVPVVIPPPLPRASAGSSAAADLPPLVPSAASAGSAHVQRFSQTNSAVADLIAVSVKKKKKKKSSHSPGEATPTTSPSPPPPPVTSTPSQPPPVTSTLSLPPTVTTPPSQPPTITSTPSQPPTVTYTPSQPPLIISLAERGGEERGEGSLTDLAKLPNSLSSSLSNLSVASFEGGGAPMFVGPSFMSNPAQSEAEAAAHAMSLVLSATGQQQQLSSSTQLPADSALSAEEMKQALLSMVRSKEEQEERSRVLEARLSEVAASRAQLAGELEQVQEELSTLRESLSSQQQALERENDLLREQVRKYVGMVGMVRRDSTARPADSAQHSPSDVSPDRPSPQLGRSPSLSKSQDEKKLTQMAEMYGEIMELNERLHRSIANKDTVICKLVHAIRHAGLKVPVSAEQLPPAALEPVKVVEVCIPSVIKKGRGPDAYHVYQVLVKLNAEEWNIYRRYAEFREFHRQLSECLPELASFNFPPKRAIGNKSSQVVEERRQRLQEYLRRVVSLCTSDDSVPGKNRRKKRIVTEPFIRPGLTKEKLVEMLPFLNEDLNLQQVATVQSPSYSGL